MSKVDICITTYRNVDKLKTCLETVLEKTKFVDYKIYLWANDPTEEVKKTIHDSMYIDNILFNDHIEPIFNDDNSGSFSSNNNAVAKEGTGEYILFLNDDIYPLRDDWLYNMLNIIENNSKVGVVGSLLLYPDQKTIQHCGVFFSNKTNSLPYHMFYKQSIDKVSNFISHHRYYQAITGACMLMRRKDFEEVGGFNTQYYYGYEDIHLCLDIKKILNKSSVYCADSILVHNEGISGSFKNHPKIQDNIKIFKELNKDRYYNDLEFYLNDNNFMTFNIKK